MVDQYAPLSRDDLERRRKIIDAWKKFSHPEMPAHGEVVVPSSAMGTRLPSSDDLLRKSVMVPVINGDFREIGIALSSFYMIDPDEECWIGSLFHDFPAVKSDFEHEQSISSGWDRYWGPFSAQFGRAQLGRPTAKRHDNEGTVDDFGLLDAFCRADRTAVLIAISNGALGSKPSRDALASLFLGADKRHRLIPVLRADRGKPTYPWYRAFEAAIISLEVGAALARNNHELEAAVMEVRRNRGISRAKVFRALQRFPHGYKKTD